MALCPLFVRLHKLGFKKVLPGPYLLVCNHISHFDPPLLAVAMNQRIDYLTMAELFKSRWFAWWLHLVGTFPVNRTAKDFRAVRTVIRRLRKGHIVGVFPEGGIRTGAESVVGGASMPKSSAALAHLGRCPIRTCLILGSDQLYDWRSLFRRPSIYVIYGDEFVIDPHLPRLTAREQLTHEVESSFRALYQKLHQEGKITPAIRPRSAQDRWAEAGGVN